MLMTVVCIDTEVIEDNLFKVTLILWQNSENTNMIHKNTSESNHN